MGCSLSTAQRPAVCCRVGVLEGLWGPPARWMLPILAGRRLRCRIWLPGAQWVVVGSSSASCAQIWLPQIASGPKSQAARFHKHTTARSRENWQECRVAPGSACPRRGRSSGSRFTRAHPGTGACCSSPPTTAACSSPAATDRQTPRRKPAPTQTALPERGPAIPCPRYSSG